MKTKTTVRPKLGGMARANKGTAIKAATGRRTVASHRAKIEALFEKLATEQLADLWQRLYPLPIEPDCELPDRQGMVEDLADFGQVLQPNSDGLNADQLCWLIDKCARACKAAGQAHERLRPSPCHSFRNAPCRYRHRFVVRAGCELL